MMSNHKKKIVTIFLLSILWACTHKVPESPKIQDKNTSLDWVEEDDGGWYYYDEVE
jgi:hypothetical protein